MLPGWSLVILVGPRPVELGRLAGRGLEQAWLAFLALGLLAEYGVRGEPALERV